MSELRDLLVRTANEIADYREGAARGRVFPDLDPASLRAAFGGPLPDRRTPPSKVIDDLVAAAAPGLVATTGPRYFGFVIGGALDSATAADVLATGWDQPAYNAVSAPAAAVVEEVSGDWLKQLLGLPERASFGFVTGAQAANTVGLAAARHHVLTAAGHDVERDGLVGAPRVRVIASVERHATIDRSLRLLGFGSALVEEVAADGNGAIDVGRLREVLGAAPPGPTIVVLQSGNVNTGACDDLAGATAAAHAHGAWVHVDGAFGLWAAASPTFRHLVAGIETADSWGCDGHKWLNVPYDSGYVFCAHPAAHAAAMAYTAAYLALPGVDAVRGPGDFVPESSRRARGLATWAAIRELGREGVAELIDRCCALATRFADQLRAADGVEVLNDVVLNQVLVRFGSGSGADRDAITDRVIAAVQESGECWMGATTWHGARLMRISVSNWSTTEADVDRSVAAMLAAARGARVA
jgi:glutamate/tyrosine decarboxylase-like PLP-dependent enzyme